MSSYKSTGQRSYHHIIKLAANAALVLLFIIACNSSKALLPDQTPAVQFPRAKVSLGMNSMNYINGPDESDLEMHKQMNSHAERIWIYWQDIEPKPGKFTWSKYDAIIAKTQLKGMEPWALIVGAPQFACARGRLTDRKDNLAPPKLEPYKTYLQKLVNHYKGKIHYYEIWNEPNLEYYWMGGVNLGEYAELLKESYFIIKSVDPDATVIMAGTGGTNLPDLDNMLKQLGGADVFDALAAHPYWYADQSGMTTLSPLEPHTIDLPNGEKRQVTLKEELLLYRETLSNNGYENKSIWLTEFGWAAYNQFRSTAYASLKEQAAFLRQSVQLFRNDPDLDFVKGIFWFSDADWGTDPNDPVAQKEFGFFGLTTAEKKWKPAAYTFRQLAQMN